MPKLPALILFSAFLSAVPVSSAHALPFLVGPAGARIEKITQDKTCKTDADCDMMGVGSRPCGGPEMYIIYSHRKTSTAALKKAVNQYNGGSHKTKPGTVGICSVLERPEVACTQKKCSEK